MPTLSHAACPSPSLLRLQTSNWCGAVDVPYKECAEQLRAGALPAVADDVWQDVRDAFDAVAARHAGVGSGMQG